MLDGTFSHVAGGSVAVFRDVTDEHAREVLNQQTLYALFNSLPIPLTVRSAKDFSVLSANQALLDLIGYDRHEIEGAKPPFPWWDDDGSAETDLSPGTVVHRNFRRKDGFIVPVEATVHGIRGDDGEIELLLGIVTDLSEKRLLDQQLVQSGKLAAIGQLAAGVAHEINNPLFAILALTEFLLKDSIPGTRERERLELIQETGLEIKEIVRALLDFARENADERHVVPLEDVIRATVDLIRRTNAHKDVELVDTYDDVGRSRECERQPAQAGLPEPDGQRPAGDAERGHDPCRHAPRRQQRHRNRLRQRAGHRAARFSTASSTRSSRPSATRAARASASRSASASPRCTAAA